MYTPHSGSKQTQYFLAAVVLLHRNKYFSYISNGLPLFDVANDISDCLVLDELFSEPGVEAI